MELLAGNISRDMYSGERLADLNQLFMSYRQYFPEVIAIYAGTQTGQLIYQPANQAPDGLDPRKRDWYKDAMNTDGVIFTKPYIDLATGQVIVSIAVKTQDQSGVIGMDINIDYLHGLMEEAKFGNYGHAIVLGNNGRFIYHPKKNSGDPAEESHYQEMLQKNSGQIRYSEADEDFTILYTTNELTGWKIGGTIAASEINEAGYPIMKRTTIVIAISLLISLIFVYFIIRSIVKPIKKLQKDALTISKGDLTGTIQVKTNDEIGKLAEAMKVMQNSLTHIVQNISDIAGTITNQSEELSQAADEVKAGSEQVATTMQELASGAEKQADHSTELSNMMQDFNLRIQETSKQGQQIQQSATGMLELTMTGQQLMQTSSTQMKKIDQIVERSVEKVQQLVERSKEISRLVIVIKEIAEQTNLLALNAAIEAARAGDHGKGFAIVAEEVRKLAEQVAGSVSEISDIVGNIQNEIIDVTKSLQGGYLEVEKGTEHIQTTSHTFARLITSIKEMVQSINQVSHHMTNMAETSDKMNESTQEIAAISEEAAAGIEQTTASAQEILSAMEEVSSSSKQLAEVADQLEQVINDFKINE